jgi:hypothetical protein
MSNKQKTPPDINGTNKDLRVLEKEELKRGIPSILDFLRAAIYIIKSEEIKIKEAIKIKSFNFKKISSDSPF